jgi:hypothetical protein
VDALAPLHDNMPINLAFYHLDWARQQLDTSRDSRVEALCCSGAMKMNHAAHVAEWKSEVYFLSGSFYLKQRLAYSIQPTRRDPVYRKSTVYALRDCHVGCPHMKHSIVQVKFEDLRGILKAELHASMKKELTAADKVTRLPIPVWKSVNGPLNRANICGNCFTDMGIQYSFVDDKVMVKISSCRELGAGINRADPKWMQALRGNKCSPRRDLKTATVWEKVMHAEP